MVILKPALYSWTEVKKVYVTGKKGTSLREESDFSWILKFLMISTLEFALSFSGLVGEYFGTKAGQVRNAVAMNVQRGKHTAAHYSGSTSWLSWTLMPILNVLSQIKWLFWNQLHIADGGEECISDWKSHLKILMISTLGFALSFSGLVGEYFGTTAGNVRNAVARKVAETKTYSSSLQWKH